MTSWMILIPTIPRRAHAFEALVRDLLGQIERHAARVVPSAGLNIQVLAWLNRGEPRLGKLRDAMVDYAADAGFEYVSFVDDDDEVASTYVEQIAAALWWHRPDHVGFRLRYTKDGQEVYRGGVVHNLAYGQWGYNPGRDLLYRDFTHLDPIRTSIAQRGRFSRARPFDPEDRKWVDQVRPHLAVAKDVFLDDVLYHYRWVPTMSAWETRSSIDLGLNRVAARRPNIQSPFLSWKLESL